MLVEILKLGLLEISMLSFAEGLNEDKFDQDMWKNLWYDLKNLLWWAEPNPQVRYAFGNLFNIFREQP